MLVRDHMSRKVMSVGPRDTLDRAKDLMHERAVRHLPVLRGSRLVGVLSDRDLRRPLSSARLVQDVMTLNPTSITPDASVDEAACVMRAHTFSALPVVDKGHVIGILTTTDVLRAFVDLSGAAEQTSRIIITAKNRQVPESAVRRVVHGCHAELKWIHRHGRQLHLRLKGRQIDDVVTALEAAGFNVTAVIASRGAGTATRRRTTAVRKAAR
jgi:acetoin utilization protein AcuB